MTDIPATSVWPAIRAINRERSDNSTGEPEPTSFDDPEWKTGWTDGRVGIPSQHVLKLYEFEAKRRLADVRAKLEGEKTEANVNHQAELQNQQLVDGDYRGVMDKFHDIEKDRIENPTSYSWPLGIFYVAVAVILWIADVPLTLLAADGLGIRTNYEALSNLQVIRATWTSMWEPLAFAIGIAALGIFFKFVTDFFFKPRLAKRLVVRIAAGFLLVAVMAMVGYNLYVLARLRTGVRQLQEAQRQASMGVTSVDVGALAQDMESRANLSFILLTLTLPTIGGICASAGWHRIQNSIRYKTAEKEHERAREEHVAAQKLVHNTAAALATANAKLWNLPASSEGAAEAAQALYGHGFVRGFSIPETIHNGRRLHEQVDAVLRRLVTVGEQRTVVTRGHAAPAIEMIEAGVAE
ncbi:MAG TPA: hypothetical protein VNA69_10750 [Thermoanaerobaculia bacterium]|nr:hypothetical protein [Thermoanaerobaculia bacterium]